MCLPKKYDFRIQWLRKNYYNCFYISLLLKYMKVLKIELCKDYENKYFKCILTQFNNLFYLIWLLNYLNLNIVKKNSYSNTEISPIFSL